MTGAYKQRFKSESHPSKPKYLGCYPFSPRLTTFSIKYYVTDTASDAEKNYLSSYSALAKGKATSPTICLRML